MIEALAALGAAISAGIGIRQHKASKANTRMANGDFKSWEEREEWLAKPLKGSSIDDQVAYVLSVDPHDQHIPAASRHLKAAALETLVEIACTRIRAARTLESDGFYAVVNDNHGIIAAASRHKDRSDFVEDMLVELLCDWPHDGTVSGYFLGMIEDPAGRFGEGVRLSQHNLSRILKAQPSVLWCLAWRKGFECPLDVPVSTYLKLDRFLGEIIDLAGGLPSGNYHPWLDAVKSYEGTLGELIAEGPTLTKA